MTQRSTLTGGQELEETRNLNPAAGNLLRRIITAINTVAAHAGVAPIGQADAPPPPGGLNIKASGEMVHATISDTAEVDRSTEYFIEHATSQNPNSWHVEHLVASRGKFFSLPAKDDSGNPHEWRFRTYKQKPGSPPSPYVYYGGNSPAGVTLTGSTQLTPLQSTGSGTASPLGGQGGWGRGKVPIRPPQGPRGQS